MNFNQLLENIRLELNKQLKEYNQTGVKGDLLIRIENIKEKK